MKISADEIGRIAALARIDVEDSEMIRQDLNSILDYMDLLNAVDVGGVEPCFSPGGYDGSLRQDQPEPSLTRAAALQNAPAVMDGAVVVPKVIE